MNKYLIDNRNLTMLTDFYELTMMAGYLDNEVSETPVVFDLFYRKNPDNGGYVIATGLEQVIEYINNLHFDQEDLDYLKEKGFNDKFIDYCRNFKFTGTIHAVKEGTVVYPYEPIVQVVAPMNQAQLVETALLLTINHQSLIATKASRIKRTAGDALVMEFGARRAHSYDGAIIGARASYIGGADATATVSADQYYDVKAVGTMAHSWVQFFDDEYEAFKAYAKAYPDNCSILIDTYNVLKSGLPNAIRLHKEVLAPQGKALKGIRIDSGDLAYLSKQCRKILDENGMQDTKIIVSNSIDEYTLESLNNQKAPIDSYGIGERMITSKSDPVFGGVYKLASVYNEITDTWEPRIKLSENTEKITNPGYKQIYRLYNEEGYSICDVIAFRDEEAPKPNVPYKVVPMDKYYRTYEITPSKVEPLLIDIFKDGNQIYTSPNIHEIKQYAKSQLEQIWDEEKRLHNPNVHWVDLSEKLNKKKMEMIEVER